MATQFGFWRHPMKNILFLTLLLTMLFLGALGAEAANHYVRAGAGGTGTSWSNACSDFTGSCASGSLVRGDTYWVATGTYAGRDFNTAIGSGATITIKKASVSSHGCTGTTGECTGWNDSYGTGQALFNGQIRPLMSNFVIDGSYRDESNPPTSWSTTAAYGFRTTSIWVNSGSGISNVVFQYLDVGNTDGTVCTYTPTAQCPWGSGDDLVYLASGSFSNLTFSRMHLHNGELMFMLINTTGVVIEYSWMNEGWQKEAIRGGNGGSTQNTTIRYNVFKDTCKGHPTQPGASHACTADIAMWSQPVDGNEIYGNVFIKTTNYPGDGSATSNNNGAIFIGTNNPRPVANNTKIYDNTIVGCGGTSCQVGSVGSGTNNLVYNNIWYASTATGCAGTCANNELISSGSQFVNPLTTYPATGFDYHLASATAAGTMLASPYNQDMKGLTRGTDGVWDRGAFEFRGGGGADIIPPAAPIDLRIQ